ncbi:MAG: ribose ABC transporter [Methylobacterium sp.]|nr:MAG: ribose ABC transporter [Methylobacterium sp.]
MALAPGQVLAQAAGEGLTEPRALPPFQADAPRCAAPEGRNRTLVFLQDNEREFMMGVQRGLAAAAKARGLAFERKLAANDPAAMNRQAEEARAAAAGAVVVAPIDPTGLAPRLKALIADGTYVGAIVPPPAVSILNAPQFLTGSLLGEAAVQYIQAKLGGRARVVILTHDTNQYLAPRFAAMRQALKKLPGVVIVADISPSTVDRAGGFAVMQKVLLANRRIDVVLGADTVVLGALDAARAAGANRPEQFFGGIDGEPDAIAELRKRGEYKATVSLSSPVFAYAMGQHAADWLEGRSIPQAMDILPRLVTSETLAAFEADALAPDAVYADPARRETYLRMYGNICAASRDRFINFPWSSERK